MNQISRFLSVFVVLFSLAFGHLAYAGAAQSYLETKQKELTAIIKKPKSTENDEKLKVTFDALLDYDAFAQDSLGPEWGKLTEGQRKEFQELLKTLVQRSYTKNLRN